MLMPPFGLSPAVAADIREKDFLGEDEKAPQEESQELPGQEFHSEFLFSRVLET